jgi:hypothetical protein
MAQPFMRIRLLTVVFACGIGVGAGIMNALRPATKLSGTATASLANSELSPIERALERVVPEVWVVNQPVEVVAAKVSAASGAPVRVDRKGAERREFARGPTHHPSLRGPPLIYVLSELALPL